MRVRSNRPRALLICALVAGLAWSLPVAGEEEKSVSSPADSSSLSRSEKINPILARTLDRLERAGVTPSTMGTFDLEQFSDRLVRLDRQGSIQVEIYVDRLDDDALSELRDAGVRVELTNRRHEIVQGWVPFHLLEPLARLSNVKRIRPPDYGVSRGRREVPPRSVRQPKC